MPGLKWIFILLFLLLIVISSMLKWKKQMADQQVSLFQTVAAFIKILFLSVVIVVFISLPFFDQLGISNKIMLPVGIILVIIGSMLNIFAARELVKIKFQMKGLGIPDRLITKGLFSSVRHPSSLGVVLLLIGWYLIWDALYCIYFLVPLIVIGIYIENKLEEKNLERIFGDEFRAYKKSVGMYFPKIWGKK